MCVVSGVLLFVCDVCVVDLVCVYMMSFRVFSVWLVLFGGMMLGVVRGIGWCGL